MRANFYKIMSSIEKMGGSRFRSGTKFLTSSPFRKRDVIKPAEKRDFRLLNIKQKGKLWKKKRGDCILNKGEHPYFGEGGIGIVEGT